MPNVIAVDPDAFFLSWQTARLKNKDLKPMGPAGLTHALLVWRQWLAFCAAHGVAWDTARSADIAQFTQAIGPRSSVKKKGVRRKSWTGLCRNSKAIPVFEGTKETLHKSLVCVNGVSPA